MLKQEICACHSCQTQDKAGKPHAHYLGHMQAACAKAFFIFLLLLLFKGGQSAFNKCLLQGGGGQALSP